MKVHSKPASIKVETRLNFQAQPVRSVIKVSLTRVFKNRTERPWANQELGNGKTPFCTVCLACRATQFKKGVNGKAVGCYAETIAVMPVFSDFAITM